MRCVRMGGQLPGGPGDLLGPVGRQLQGRGVFPLRVRGPAGVVQGMGQSESVGRRLRASRLASAKSVTASGHLRPAAIMLPRP